MCKVLVGMTRSICGNADRGRGFGLDVREEGAAKCIAETNVSRDQKPLDLNHESKCSV